MDRLEVSTEADQSGLEPIAIPFQRAPKVTGHSLTRLKTAVREKRLTVRKDGKSRVVEMTELRRYLRSLPVLGRSPEGDSTSEWQPIETAPKDGTEFDAWGYYLPDSGCRPDNPVPERITDVYWGQRDSHYVKPKKGWVTLGGDGWAWAVELSHWMPLPDPPK